MKGLVGVGDLKEAAACLGLIQRRPPRHLAGNPVPPARQPPLTPSSQTNNGWVRNSTIGAGDTFIAGMLYGLTCRRADWDTRAKLRFAVDLATLKVQREGFDGLGRDAEGQL